MAYYNYPTISVGGVGGMKVYSLDYEAPSIDSAGSVTVTFIDKNNILTPPSLTAKSSSLIVIGSLSFRGYPVSYKRTYSSSGESLMQVKYLDGSFILDKYYVGLHGKHSNSSTGFDQIFSTQNIQDGGLALNKLKAYVKFGTNPGINTQELPSWLILVGKSIDPCLTAFNEAQVSDPCDPCPQGSNQLGKDTSSINCEKLRTYKILDVDYSFSEFLDALQAKGLKIIVEGEYNNNYRASYAGTLRDVIKSWCSLFGFSFYFNDNTIYIYDLSTGVTINANFSESVILSKSDEKSIEHTHSTAGMIHYSSEGVDKDYSCSSNYGKKIICRPLNLRDLGVGSVRTDYGVSNESNFYDLIELLSTFTAYSPALRETSTWFDTYRITSASAAKSLVSSSRTSGGAKYGGYYNLGLDDDINNVEYSLPMLAMTLKAVYDNTTSEFQNLMAGTTLDDSVKKKALDSKYGAYFFVASRNEAKYANMSNWESEIGNNFLGKYFLRYYENYSTTLPTITACQNDNVTMYKQGTSYLDFANFMPSFDDMAVEFGSNTAKYPKPSNLSSLPIYKFNSRQGAVKDSFILVNRNVHWRPSIGSGKEINDILKTAEPYQFVQLGPVGSFGSFINNHPKAKDKAFGTNDMLYIGFSMNGFGVTTSTVNHPDEEAFGDSCNVDVDAFSTPLDLGIGSRRCTKIKIGGVSIYMPPQARVNDSTQAGYSVYVTHGMAMEYKKVVPKMEAVVAKFENSDNVLRNDINWKDGINMENVSPTKVDSNSNCIPNYSQILERMSLLSENMASLVDEPSKKYTYEINGLPTRNYSPKDGLTSFSVRVGSRGVSSTLTFSDMKDRDIRPSETIGEFNIIKNSTLSNHFNTQIIGHNLLSNEINDNSYLL